MQWFTGNALWHLVEQSDAISKFVLILLFVMSVVCWTVFISKILLLRVRRRQLKTVLAHVQHSSTINELCTVATHHEQTLGGYFIAQQLTFLRLFLKNDADNAIALPEAAFDMIGTHLDQSIDTLIEQERSYVSLLATAAGVAPLLGLFGTVWGLVHAFMRISERQVADITTVAPGIAEALMTTLAGLMVAIPALVMFNYVQSQVRSVEQLLLHLADRVAVSIQYSLQIRRSDAPYQTPTSSSDAHRHISHTSC